MTEESTIQCENCGTIYPDTDEVCPYCGAPQPLPGPYPDEPYYDEPYYDDEGPLEEELYAGQDDDLPDEVYPSPTPDAPLEEEYADGYPVDGPYAEDDIFAIAGEETDQAEYDDEYDDLYDEYDPATGTLSMARTTGYTCTAVARDLAPKNRSRCYVSL